MPGVFTTAVGYAGGITPNPTYREVCSGRTGHAEAVRVAFDPARVTYAELLRLFWEHHDPTQGMRQGNDVGTQYRSAIYVAEDAQRAAAEASRDAYQARLTAAGYGAITTEIVDAGPFYLAEVEHQQYLHKVPNGYCPDHGTGVACPLGLPTSSSGASPSAHRASVGQKIGWPVAAARCLRKYAHHKVDASDTTRLANQTHVPISIDRTYGDVVNQRIPSAEQATAADASAMAGKERPSPRSAYPHAHARTRTAPRAHEFADQPRIAERCHDDAEPAEVRGRSPEDATPAEEREGPSGVGPVGRRDAPGGGSRRSTCRGRRVRAPPERDRAYAAGSSRAGEPPPRATRPDPARQGRPIGLSPRPACAAKAGRSKG